MRPGSLRHIITFQKLDDNQDDFGEQENYIDFKKVRAEVLPISGKEFYVAESEVSSLSHKIRIRFVEGITPNMRIKFNNRYLKINYIRNLQETNRELLIFCEEYNNYE